ncbi:glycosyltransferase family 39 protein [Patescibacteria group bacterium]|nr:glycosyltransferase family 39 protein [Patescibacteria group bacterium]
MKKRLFLILFSLILVLATGLRLYGITKFPPSLYWEEAALGYDAFSILRTGKDHHGNPFPIVAFESFGDWKPSLYFYAIVPFIKLLGLTELAVRLPAALSGIVIVIGIGLLARQFAKEKKNKDILQIITMGVTAISPWAIVFSRAGWEVNLATALILWSVVLFMKGLNHKKKQLWWFLSGAILLSLSMYAYHAARIVAPLLGLGLAIIWIKTHQKNWTQLLIPAVASLILVAPILLSLGRSQTTQRFAETSIFSNIQVIQESNLRRERTGNSLLGRAVYHRYVLFGKEILTNFFDHFQGDFLFISGDINPRHSIGFIGTFYHLEAVFLLLGFYALFNRKIKYRWFLLWWLVIGILPAALTRTTPHALRILPTLPVWMILIGLGISECLNLTKKYKKILGVIILLVYLGELVIFWRFYSKIYPHLYAQEWQVGYKEMIAEVEAKRIANPDRIIYLSRENGRPAMYYWFYTQTDPREVQAVNAVVKKDQGEFLEFKNLRFVNGIDENFYLE